MAGLSSTLMVLVEKTWGLVVEMELFKTPMATLRWHSRKKNFDFGTK